jgi:hypothetical protein
MAGTIVSDTIQNGTGASTSTTNVINGSAKAWCSVSGYGGATIRAAYNVSSVTYVGTGQYQFNFTNAFADANYSVIGFQSWTANNSTNSNADLGPSTNILTTSCTVYTGSGGWGAYQYANVVCMAVFR